MSPSIHHLRDVTQGPASSPSLGATEWEGAGVRQNCHRKLELPPRPLARGMPTLTQQAFSYDLRACIFIERCVCMTCSMGHTYLDCDSVGEEPKISLFVLQHQLHLHNHHRTKPASLPNEETLQSKAMSRQFFVPRAVSFHMQATASSDKLKQLRTRTQYCTSYSHLHTSSTTASFDTVLALEPRVETAGCGGGSFT